MANKTASIRYVEDKNGDVFFPVTHQRGVVDSDGNNLETTLSGKQDTLVSGTSIKTINGSSILGSGDIQVQTEITMDNVPTSGSNNPVKSGGLYTELAEKIGSQDIDNVVELTLAQYNALATKDARTIYIISDSTIASDHVGVASLVQTTTSTEDGGTNVWTCTLTNGQSFTLEVKNGNQGNSGYSGAAGELEVVNNVTQGGATAALSAEMGKQLEGEISQLGLEIYEQVPGGEETINPNWEIGSIKADGSAFSTSTRCRTMVLNPGDYRITPSSGYFVMFIAHYSANAMNSANFIEIAYNYDSDKSTKEITHSTSNFLVIVVARADDANMSNYVADMTSYVPINKVVPTQGDSKISVLEDKISVLEDKVAVLEDNNTLTFQTGESIIPEDGLGKFIQQNGIWKETGTGQMNYDSTIIKLKSKGNFTINITEGRTSIGFLPDNNPIPETQSNIVGYGLVNDGDTIEVPAGFEYLYVIIRTPEETRHVSISDLSMTLKDYVTTTETSGISGLTFIETNIIATTGNKILKLTIEDNTEYLNYSGDYGETWTKIANSIGRIAFVHWFSDGTCMIAGHTKIWTTKDFVTFSESTIYDYDGSIFVPNDYHFFSLQNNYNEMYYINGEEVAIWCDYGVRSNYISRVWMATAHGSIVRCILKNRETLLTNGTTVAVRHFHMICFDRLSQELWVSSGDSASECQLIKGVLNNQHTFDFSLMASGLRYKLGRLWLDENFIYATTDYDGVSGVPVGILRFNKYGPIDTTCLSYLTTIPETAISNYHKDNSGYKFLFLDGSTSHNGIIYIAPPFSREFKKSGVQGCSYVPNSILGMNDNGDVIVRCSDGFATTENSEQRLSLNREGEGVLWNLSESIRNSGYNNFNKVDYF